MAKKSQKKKGDRIIIHLACQECHTKNYSTKKNKKNDTGRIEMNKFCKVCKAQKTHKETK